MLKGFDDQSPYEKLQGIIFINMDSDAPLWAYQTSKEHLLGLFIPPFLKDE
jgi:hypothetical protein